jgi:hypothetical protein
MSSLGLKAYLNVITQYYAKKSKNFSVLIITLNNIHEFNTLRYILWILYRNLTSGFDFNKLKHIYGYFLKN